MAISFNITADKSALIYGEKSTITASGTDVPAGATTTYKWTVAGKSVAESSNTLGLTPEAGTEAVTLTATVDGTDYQSNSITLTTQQAVMPSNITLTVSPSGPFTENQLPIPLTTKVDGQPDGSTLTYYWRTIAGTVGKDSVFMATEAYSDLTLTVIVSNPNYTDFTIEQDVPVVVMSGSTPTIPEPADLLNYTILADGTPFLKLQYWSLDEIKALLIASSEGYTIDSSKSNAIREIETFQYLISSTGKIKVQESRNGRIYDQDYFIGDKINEIYPYGWYNNIQDVPGIKNIVDFSKKNTPPV